MNDKRIVEIIDHETKTTVAVFHRFERLLTYSVASIHDIQLPLNSFIQQSGEHGAISMDDWAERLMRSKPAAIVTWAVITGLSLGSFASFGIGLPIITGVSYGIGMIGKKQFKREMVTKIDQLAEQAKREIKASEYQIEAGLKDMLRGERASAVLKFD